MMYNVLVHRSTKSLQLPLVELQRALLSLPAFLFARVPIGISRTTKEFLPGRVCLPKLHQLSQPIPRTGKAIPVTMHDVSISL